MAAVLHHSQATGTAKLVLLGIANHHSDNGAWPTLATLATYANVSVRQVQRDLARLETLGELYREVQAGGTHDQPDRYRPNRYYVMVGCPPSCDRSFNHRPTRRPVDNRGDVDVTPAGQG